MAAGEYAQHQNVYKINRNLPNGFLQSHVQGSTEKNMKQVDIDNKEGLDKGRFQVNPGAHGKGKRKSSGKRRSCAVVVVGKKLLRRVSNVAASCNPVMANKENELTCSDDVRGIHYNDGCGRPLNAAEASKMAGANSKYSDFVELSKDHEAMTRVLFGRNLRLKVALTLWQKNASEFVAYLLRIQDTGVLLDILPILTNNLQSQAPHLSLGCCVDLMPQVKTIISSKYEEHLKIGLHWVQAVMKKWWLELCKNEKQHQSSSSQDRNVEVMKQRLKDLWKDGAHLCSAPGSTGELAKAIEASLSQLP